MVNMILRSDLYLGLKSGLIRSPFRGQNLGFRNVTEVRVSNEGRQDAGVPLVHCFEDVGYVFFGRLPGDRGRG